MHWPQIVFIVAMSISLYISLICHGEDRGEHNFFYKLIDVAVTSAVLYFGGFWG